MKDISELQSEGHEIINQLAEMGISKREIYFAMARALHLRAEDAHFSRTCTMGQARRMVSFLKAVRANRMKK